MRATSFHKGIHVNQEDVYEARDKCPICLSQDERFACLRIQDDPLIEMLFCKACEACSASHMPKQELLDRYYAQYYSKMDDRVTFGDPGRFARHLGTVLKPEAASSLRILDFGGGDASLAIALAQKFQVRAGSQIPILIDVVDYEKPRETSVPNVVVNGYRDLDEVGGPYDVLLASAILEHIPDAHSTIRKFVGMAGPGAFMYARTPYVVPLARLVSTIDTTYPAHVHDMGSGFWSRFAETFNLRARLLLSRPSLVETTLCSNPVRTVLAQALKFPALAELWLSKQVRVPKWKLVGGWEVVLHFF
jgi:2-polyprenyl-3-methyl-5-hydroxy-6-metoxy-1,4-benzoquinol methylase